MPYYAVYSTLIDDIVGTCLDPKDCYEPAHRYIRLTQNEYVNFWEEIKKDALRLAEVKSRPKWEWKWRDVGRLELPHHVPLPETARDRQMRALFQRLYERFEGRRGQCGGTSPDGRWSREVALSQPYRYAGIQFRTVKGSQEALHHLLHDASLPPWANVVCRFKRGRPYNKEIAWMWTEE